MSIIKFIEAVHEIAEKENVVWFLRFSPDGDFFKDNVFDFVTKM